MQMVKGEESGNMSQNNIYIKKIKSCMNLID